MLFTVSVQNLCLAENLSMGCGPKCSRPIRLQYLQKNEAAWFFAYWDQFKKIRFWSISFWVGMVKIGCGQSSYETLKLNVSQEWIVGLNWFFTWCYKFRKVKSCFSDVWVDVAFKFMRPWNLFYLKIEWYPTQYLWLLNAGGSKQLYWFFLCTLWYLRLSLFLIKSQPVLLTKVSLIKDMQCCFEEITFSCEFFCVFILYFSWTIFPNKYFQRWGLGKNIKSGLTI